MVNDTNGDIVDVESESDIRLYCNREGHARPTVRLLAHLEISFA